MVEVDTRRPRKPFRSARLGLGIGETPCNTNKAGISAGRISQVDDRAPRGLLNLPREIVQEVAKHLEPVDGICLSLTCRDMKHVLPWNIPGHFCPCCQSRDRLRLLHRLARNSTNYWMCFKCAKLHRVQQHDVPLEDAIKSLAGGYVWPSRPQPCPSCMHKGSLEILAGLQTARIESVLCHARRLENPSEDEVQGQPGRSEAAQTLADFMQDTDVSLPFQVLGRNFSIRARSHKKIVRLTTHDNLHSLHCLLKSTVTIKKRHATSADKISAEDPREQKNHETSCIFAICRHYHILRCENRVDLSLHVRERSQYRLSFVRSFHCWLPERVPECKTCLHCMTSFVIQRLSDDELQICIYKDYDKEWRLHTLAPLSYTSRVLPNCPPLYFTRRSMPTRKGHGGTCEVYDRSEHGSIVHLFSKCPDQAVLLIRKEHRRQWIEQHRRRLSFFERLLDSTRLLLDRLL